MSFHASITIEQETGTSNEVWDQVTQWNQRVASGIYILRIDNARDVDNEPIDGSIVKFVIMR